MCLYVALSSTLYPKVWVGVLCDDLAIKETVSSGREDFKIDRLYEHTKTFIGFHITKVTNSSVDMLTSRSS